MQGLLDSATREFLRLEGGRRLSYLVWGDAARPALLLLHGGTACAADWRQVAEPLAAEWRIVAPDQRGCGHSDWDPEARYGVEPLLEDGGPKDGSPSPLALADEIPESFRSREEALAFLSGSGFGGRGRAPWVLVPPELPGRMAALNPLVRTTEIADAGHGVHYEQPDAFVAALREFLDGL